MRNIGNRRSCEKEECGENEIDGIIHRLIDIVVNRRANNGLERDRNRTKGKAEGNVRGKV